MTNPSVKPLTVEGVTVTPTWPWSPEYRAHVKAEMSSSRYALPPGEAAQRYIEWYAAEHGLSKEQARAKIEANR